MSAVWSYPDHVAVNFTALPPVANNEGRVMRCNPLVAGQGYFYMASDGTYWRPYGGEQKGYVLAAPLDMAVNSNYQLLISIPLPPGLLVCGRSYIKTVMCADKLAGTTDTGNIIQYFGPLGTNSDPVFVNNVLATTNISIGVTNQASRLSATSIRKHGSGGTGTSNSLSSASTTVRAAAITVGNLDTVTNYLTVYGKMTTGTTEYLQLHSFSLEFMG